MRDEGRSLQRRDDRLHLVGVDGRADQRSGEFGDILATLGNLDVSERVIRALQLFGEEIAGFADMFGPGQDVNLVSRLG